MPVPAVTVWTGLTQSPERGAGAGLLAGGLLYLLGGSPWEMGRLALVGGLSGAVAPREGGRWRHCLLALPLLAGWEALRLAALWCGGAAVGGALPLLGRELLLTAGVVPLLGLWEARRASYGGASAVSLRRSRRQRGRGPALRGCRAHDRGPAFLEKPGEKHQREDPLDSPFR